jgi:hypothetical protein
MTNTREILEKCARAMGKHVLQDTPYNRLKAGRDDEDENERLGLLVRFSDETAYWWNPLESNGDCAEMCAQLMIDTEWYVERVKCLCFQIETGLEDKFELYADHNNDRLAAWRHAACQVAAMMEEEHGAC